LVLIALVGTGCRVVNDAESLPMNAMGSVIPGTRHRQPDPAALQAEVLRFADTFGGEAAAALDEYARRVNTPEVRIKVLKWKVALYSSAIDIATGPNPNANLIDLVALASLLHAAVAEVVSQAVSPGAFDACLDASRIQDTNAWKLAQAFLSSDQLSELHAAIDQWRANHPSLSDSFFERPQELVSAVRQTGQDQGQPGGIFSMLGLDPMSGLDPAVREVTRTRLFAERALFAAEHMPFLLRWQVELMSEQILREDQVTAALQSADRLSRAAESLSQTAALLPNRITDERKAILDALEAQEGKLQGLSAQVGQTLTDGEKMSTSLNTTLITFTALMKRFGVGEPSTTPPDTNSAPFNILDYARTAEQVAAMAQQLDLLIKDANGTVQTPALDKRIAELSALEGTARADAKSVLNHAFLLAAGLIVLTFACATVYRRVSRHPP
jgi:hypothetical protein